MRNYVLSCRKFSNKVYNGSLFLISLQSIFNHRGLVNGMDYFIGDTVVTTAPHLTKQDAHSSLYLISNLSVHPICFLRATLRYVTLSSVFAARL